MKWHRLDESVEIHYRGLEELLGYEVEERPRSVIVAVKRGTSFCDRPIYHYTVYFKGKKLTEGRVLVRHWAFEEGPAPMGPSTLGFGIFFPEIIESAYKKTPAEEQEDIAYWTLKELSSRSIDEG